MGPLTGSPQRFRGSMSNFDFQGMIFMAMSPQMGIQLRNWASNIKARQNEAQSSEQIATMEQIGRLKISFKVCHYFFAYNVTQYSFEIDFDVRISKGKKYNLMPK